MNNFKLTTIETKGNEDYHTGNSNIILSSDENYILLIGGAFEQDTDGYIAKIQENKFNKNDCLQRKPNK